MILYRKGYKYQLAEDYSVMVSVKPAVDFVSEFIELTTAGKLTISSGYAWDGPSGPTKEIAEILARTLFVGKWLLKKFLKNFLRGSLVHDALYQILRHGGVDQTLREACDKELRTICLQDGMSKSRAWWVYRGVRIGAGPAAKPKNMKKTLEAP